MDIFDLVFDGFMAFNQLGFLFGGGVCLLLGGLLVGDALYSRLVGTRLRGRIVGIRAMGIKDPEHEINEQQREDVKPALEKINKSFKQEFFEAPIRTFFASLIVMVFVLMPFAFFGVGAYVAYDYASLKVAGIEVSATIADNEAVSGDDGTSYYAVVAYTDNEGYYHRVRDSMGRGGSPSYGVGEKVQVFYDAEDPEHFIIDDFWHYMILSIAFMAMASIFFVFMSLGYFGTKKPAKTSNTQKKKAEAKDYKSEMYYPVYEFRMPNGDVEKITDSGGTNMLQGNRLGKNVTLFLRGDKPENAKRPGMVQLIIGGIFLVPGVLFTYLALTTFEFTVMTPVLALAFIGWAAFKINKSKVIKPREMWESRHEFKVRMDEKRIKKQAAGRLLSVDEIKARLVHYDKQIMWSLPITGIIAAGMIAGGVYLWNDMNEKTAQGIHAEGKIVRIESVYDSSSDSSGYTYYGVVKYETPHGDDYEFRDSVGSSSALFEKGDVVDVLYDPENPYEAIIDRGIWNHAPGAGLMFFGGLLMFWVLRSFLTIRSRQNRF